MFSKASGEPLQLTIQESFAGKQTRSWSPWSSEVWVTGFHFKINCPPDTTIVHPWLSTNSLFLHTNVCIHDHDIYILKHGCWQNHWASVAVLFRFEMRHLRQCVLWEEDGIYIRPMTTFSTELMTPTPSASLNGCTICVTNKKKKKR